MNHNDYEEPTDTLRDEILAKPGIDDYELRAYFATLIMGRFNERNTQRLWCSDAIQYIKMIAEQEGDGFVKLLLEAGYRYDAAIEARDWFLAWEWP